MSSGQFTSESGQLQLEPALDPGEGRALHIPGHPGRLGKYEATVIGTLTIVGILIAWQLVAMARLAPREFFPGPSDIIGAYSVWSKTGDIGNDIWISTREVVIGFVISVAVGLPIGLVLGWYRRLAYALDPVISFFNATPRIALIPLIVIWFGIGLPSKIVIVFISSVIAIIINAQVGVQSIDPNLLAVARSFGASDWNTVRTVALPGALPYILAGLRLAIGHALIAMVVAELVAAQAGIGLMMSTAGEAFQTPEVFAGLFVIAGMGIVLTTAFQRLERHFRSWRVSH